MSLDIVDSEVFVALLAVVRSVRGGPAVRFGRIRDFRIHSTAAGRKALSCLLLKMLSWA